jgi:hypothetical protein
MRKFLSFSEARKTAKKKKSEDHPTPPTNVSSPLRGANQDYSGVSPSHDHADYTVSD